MRLTLAIRTPDGTIWRRQVERDYPGVPRPGDWVYLADTDDGTGLFATPVSLISFENDGRLTLTFNLQDTGQAAQLEAFGFTRS
jgi:hypothetical protein